MLLFALAFVITLGVYIWVQLYYSSHLPLNPNVGLGQTYRMTVNHGFVVFGTKADYEFYQFSESGFKIGFVCGGIFGALYARSSIARPNK